MLKILSLKAKEILDSRGNPTIEVSLTTKKGKVISSVPSGASKGEYEAFELRDGGKRYNGKGVLKAVSNINKIIAPKILNKNVLNQRKTDDLMINLDGTSNKSKLGGNSVLGVSLAVCRAGAIAEQKPLYKYINSFIDEKISLPRPCFNLINGGTHAGNDLDFQEFMIVPKKNKVKESIREAAEFYFDLKKKIKNNYSSSAVNIGDEGGFAPPLNNAEDALKLILGIKKIDLILDVASGEFYDKESYKLGIKLLKRKELTDYYLKLIKKYPIIGLEDPFAEDDYEGWKMLKDKVKNSKTMIIGDDLLATNSEKIEIAEKNNYCDSMILKLNQIGTVSEAIESAKLAKKYNWKIIVSHRSGETNDDFISDFAVGINSDYIKAGAPARGERIAKYNRLMQIEDELSKKN